MATRTTPLYVLIPGILATACGYETNNRSIESRPQATQEVQVALVGAVSGSPEGLAFDRLPLQTGSALVTTQGRPCDAATIQPGSVIRGMATKSGWGYQLLFAEVHHEVEGTIERVDTASSRLIVMGQTVQMDPATCLGEEGPGGCMVRLQPADMKAGDRVEVDGSPAPDGSVLATRIQVVPASGNGEGYFHGVLRSLDNLTKTAAAGGCVLMYGTALVVGPLANGTRVEIHGRRSGKILHATWVKVDPVLDDLKGATLELAGPISGFDPVARTFRVMSCTVDYSRAQVEGSLADGVTVVGTGPLARGEAFPVHSGPKAAPRVALAALKVLRAPLRGNLA